MPFDPGLRAIFFDAVGTIMHPARPVAETYLQVGKRHGVRLTEATIQSRIRAAFKVQDAIDERTGWRTDEERELQRWRTIVHTTLAEAADPEACFQELWSWYSQPAAWIVPDDAVQILQTLKNSHLAFGVASNFDERLAGLVAAMPELAPLASNCIISSRIGWRKPAAEFFREVVRRAGCEPQYIMFVGDDERNDQRGALAAGMKSVLVRKTWNGRDRY